MLGERVAEVFERPSTLAVQWRGSGNSVAAKDLAAAEARNPAVPTLRWLLARRWGGADRARQREASDELNGLCAPTSSNLQGKHEEAAPRNAAPTVLRWLRRPVVLGCEDSGDGTARRRYCARGLAQYRSNSQATWRSGSVGEARTECGVLAERTLRPCWYVGRLASPTQMVLKASQQERGATWLAGAVSVIEERAHTLVEQESA